MPELIENLLVWGKDGIEENTLEQAARTASLPFVEHPMALMPDAHFGMGSTVGSVIATKGAIVPAAVGVDIGCGMIAAKTNYKAENLPDSLDALHTQIAEIVPAGVGKGHDMDIHARFDGQAWAEKENQPAMVLRSNKNWSRATSQFGSLGSGNHFVEICLDQDDYVWVVLHSGSRGIGNEIAKRHIEGAKKLMRRYFIELPDPDLAFFAQHTPEFQEYIHDMLWAQEYAKTNRDVMAGVVLEALEDEVEIELRTDMVINCHHNYTEQESHHNQNLWVTRKGAIRAREGDMGIIPGSMATGTFIVEGKGNPASYCSASHGAGRKMSRRKAKDSLTAESLTTAMEGQAWNHRAVDRLVDEHPEAYKSIESVMEAQSDLVTVTHQLKSILNYKGVN